MKTPKDSGSIFPSHEVRSEKLDNGMETFDSTHFTGLTKRELFAGMALIGCVAGRNNQANFIAATAPSFIAESCVRYADALIVELGKSHE